MQRLLIFGFCVSLFHCAVAAPTKTTSTALIAHLSPTQLRGQIAFMRKDDLWVVSPQSKAEQCIMRGIFAYGVDISPDLQSIVSGVYGDELIIRSLDGSPNREFKIRKSLNPYVSPGSVQEPRWSPNGKQIAYTLGTEYSMGGPPKYSSEVRIINADGTNDHHVSGTTSPNGPEASRVLWSRDGKRVAFDFYRGTPDYRDMDRNAKTERLWANVDGSDVRPVDVPFNAFFSPSVSRDGKKWLQIDQIEGDKILRLYQATEGRKLQPSYAGQVTYEAGGFVLNPSQLSFGPTNDDIAFGGSLRFAFIDANGDLGLPNSNTKPQVEGIFLQTKVFPRLIARNAHLIKWL